MYTMEQKKKPNPEIRVYPHTRQRLKVMAAQHNKTIQDFVEWLVSEQERREKEKSKDDQKL